MPDGDKFPFGWVELAQIQWESGRIKSLPPCRLDAKALPLTEEGKKSVSGLKLDRHSVAAMSERRTEESRLRRKPNTEAEEYYGALDLTGRRTIFPGTHPAELRLPGVRSVFTKVSSSKMTNGPPAPWHQPRMNEGAPALSGDGR